MVFPRTLYTFWVFTNTIIHIICINTLRIAALGRKRSALPAQPCTDGCFLRVSAHAKPCTEFSNPAQLGPKGFYVTIHQTLKDTFNYDPDTGALTYREPRGSLPAGRPAGTAIATGYNVKYMGSFILAHRIIWNMMTGEWPQHPVRHANGDKLDNRWANLSVPTPLRERDPVTRKPVKHDPDRRVAHGVSRVVFAKMGQTRFETNVTISGKRVFIGRFETEAEARDAFEDITGYAAPGSL